ncbi:MAG TPA: hypothetical protein VHC20_05525 [Candidatus Paceibacterota bacterium]|nr:hypothetical protein [Candidatus Paceibacterota bacterium]
MNRLDEVLHETKPGGNGAPILARPRFNATRLFVEKDRMAWFWFLFAMLVLVLAAVDRAILVSKFQQRERVVVIDPAGTFYVSPVLKFQEAKQLHAEQSTFAAIAFLSRSPRGFDNEDLLKQMFGKRAAEKANAQRMVDEPEFKAKQLHQKVEIARIDILQTREDFILTQVNGQLIRNGVFQDKAFSESLPFRLSLKFVRNPNMILNGRFLTVVTDFKYETSN